MVEKPHKECRHCHSVNEMSEYQKKMLAALKRVQKTFQEMSDEELDRRFNESKVTEEQVKQYAVLERMILAEGRKD